MWSFTGNFKASSTDALENYSKTKYFGASKTHKTLKTKISNGELSKKNAIKKAWFCYPGINMLETLYFSGKRAELQRKGKVSQAKMNEN